MQDQDNSSLSPTLQNNGLTIDQSLEHDAWKLLNILACCSFVKVVTWPDLHKMQVELCVNTDMLGGVMGTPSGYSTKVALNNFGASNISDPEHFGSRGLGSSSDIRFSIDANTNPQLVDLMDRFFDKLVRNAPANCKRRKYEVETLIARQGYCIESDMHFMKRSYLMTGNPVPEMFYNDEEFKHNLTTYLQAAKHEKRWELTTPLGIGNQRFVGMNLATIKPIEHDDQHLQEKAYANFFDGALKILGIDCHRVRNNSPFQIESLDEAPEFLVISNKQSLDKAVALGFISAEMATEANYAPDHVTPRRPKPVHRTLANESNEVIEAAHTKLGTAIDAYAKAHPSDKTAEFIQHYFAGTYLSSDESGTREAVERFETLARRAIAFRGAEIDASLIEDKAIDATLDKLIKVENTRRADVRTRVDESLLPIAAEATEAVRGIVRKANAATELLPRRQMMLSLFLKGGIIGASAAVASMKESSPSDEMRKLRQAFIAECQEIARKSEDATTNDEAFGQLFDAHVSGINKSSKGQAFTAGAMAGAAAETIAETALEHLLIRDGFATVYVEALASTIRPRIEAVVDWNAKLLKDGKDGIVIYK